MRNRDIASNFVNGYQEGEGSHLTISKVTINGKPYLALLSYGHYPIGIITPFGVFVRVDKYSHTTAVHISNLLRALEDNAYRTDKKTYPLPIKDTDTKADFYLYKTREIICVKCDRQLRGLTDNCKPFDNCKEG